MRLASKRYKTNLALVFGLFIVSQSIFANVLASTPAKNAPITDMRGQRYCEIALAHELSAPKKSAIDVYNTIGLNNCPKSIWKNITEEKIRNQTGAKLVHLNGPRYWVIDGITDYKLMNNKVINLGGLDMWVAQILSLTWSDLAQGAKPYTPHAVHREATFVYDAGQPVYELLGPNGKKYIMTSYSLQYIYQSPNSLLNLANTLTLPLGWHFITRTLDKTKYLTTENNKVSVVRDDFFNAYQLEQPGF